MELTGREGEVVLLAMARARMISSHTVQKLSSLLYSLPLQSSLKSDYCLLISLDPAAHLHMELHYSCGAGHPIPPREPPAAAADRPAGARDRRASPLRPARILSLRPPNRPSQSQRKHLESNLEGGRKTDREGQGGNSRGWKGLKGIDPVRPSAPPLKAPPKKSNSQRATFFRSHVNDRRRGVWPAPRSRASGDPAAVTDGWTACLFARLFRSSLHENQLLRSAKEKRFI